MQRYSPGEAAAKTGFSLDTLRYYERIGLLEAVSRTSGGQRVFTEDDIGWLGMLRCLRNTGMPIAGMLRFAELSRGGGETVRDRIALLEEHDQRIEEKIATLRAEQRHVRDKINWYRTGLHGEVDC